MTVAIPFWKEQLFVSLNGNEDCPGLVASGDHQLLDVAAIEAIEGLRELPSGRLRR
jgi:hypothetical protein